METTNTTGTSMNVMTETATGTGSMGARLKEGPVIKNFQFEFPEIYCYFRLNGI